jgi:exodeoxyribonuclease VII large subunit
MGINLKILICKIKANKYYNIMSYTVSKLNEEIKNVLLDNIPERFSIEGEISNYKLSGENLFFTLKDTNSSINTTCWGYKNEDNLKNGDKVKIYGKLNLYSKSGTYSINAFKIEKLDGKGDLHIKYEELKKKYDTLGYFNNKKNLPDFIRNIGIITSSNGAALQDILFVLNKNKFFGKVYIKNSVVQGSLCPKSIAESINYFNSSPYNLDLILITRGGGSFEDLMGFSDSKVIESINKSKIYTISAVGHEVDFMLSDFAANHRAPTPSIGAETICSTQKKLKDIVTGYRDKINGIKYMIQNKIQENISGLHKLEKLNKSPEKILDEQILKLNNIKDNLKQKVELDINLKLNLLNKINDKFSNFTNENILELGYSKIDKKIVDKSGDFKLKSISSLEELKKCKNIRITFKDGFLDLSL